MYDSKLTEDVTTKATYGKSWICSISFFVTRVKLHATDLGRTGARYAAEVGIRLTGARWLIKKAWGSLSC